MPKCIYCGNDIVLEVKIGRQDECSSCHRDLHSCVQCTYYDRSFHNECRENQSEWVADKERANFCGFFVFGREIENEKNEQQKAKMSLENLFKKQS